MLTVDGDQHPVLPKKAKPSAGKIGVELYQQYEDQNITRGFCHPKHVSSD
jgi:hypothetical protein